MNRRKLVERKVGLRVQTRWQRDVQQLQGRMKRTKRMYVIIIIVIPAPLLHACMDKAVSFIFTAQFAISELSIIT